MSRVSAVERALRACRPVAALAWAVLVACGPSEAVQEDALGESTQAVQQCYCPVQYLREAPSPEMPVCPVNYYQCQMCGDGFCGAYEDSYNCPTDCGPASWCGDGSCNPGENESNCASDCYCGDGWCNGETVYTCPVDCGCPNPCGNGVCGSGESTATCPADCGSACGDGACNGSETASSCNEDCGYCGDGYCMAPETSYSCSLDCGGYCLYREVCPITLPAELQPAPES